jgi:hypothetical protein
MALSCVLSVMMVFSAQLAEGGGARQTLSLYLLYLLDSRYVAPSTLFPEKLVRYSYPVLSIIDPSSIQNAVVGEKEPMAAFVQ